MYCASGDYLVIPQLEKIPWLVHGFGTKLWKEKKMARTSELSRFRSVHLKQVHSDIIVLIKTRPAKVLTGDAMLTEASGILLTIKTADCLPVILAERQGKAIAAVHCGWKGSQKRLVQKIVKAMQGYFACRPQDLLTGLGPCISGGCYEVGEDVYSDYRRAGLNAVGFQRHPSQKGKYLLDLKEVNRFQLMELGVLEEHIFSIDLCTHCEGDLWSYRRDRRTAGRLVNFVGIVSHDEP
ncbi:MAG: peptidoglycan editing factor PgeF [Candidatus Aminicenantes bacterium]|nr:peptidoglycan editing factor PgeF [Candidatus Aminicenantes bacterium]